MFFVRKTEPFEKIQMMFILTHQLRRFREDQSIFSNGPLIFRKEKKKKVITICFSYCFNRLPFIVVTGFLVDLSHFANTGTMIIAN